MNMQMRVDDVIALTFFHIKFWNFSLFPLKHKKHVPISKYIRANNIMHLFGIDTRQVLLFHCRKMRFSSFKFNGKLWGDDIINSLICIFISTVQETFCWILRKFKISYLPYFVSDLHQIFTDLFEMFTLCIKWIWTWNGLLL